MSYFVYLCLMGLSQTEILGNVTMELIHGQGDRAKSLINKHYPFQPIERLSRSYSKSTMLQVFLRDGFIDRYTGNQLIFPGTLRAISILLPEAFPFHKNGKMDECHIAFWELLPTIDHFEPIAGGGSNESHNLITTSMIKNKEKSMWNLEQLGWELHPPGNLEDWDGLLALFLQLVEGQPELLNHPYLNEWHGQVRKIPLQRLTTSKCTS